jgi:sec-independent protein translocase protein TatA
MPIGPWELAIILVIVIIIFGAGKLPEIGGALGRGIKEFKQSTREDEEEEVEQTQPPHQQQYAANQYAQQQQGPAQGYHAGPHTPQAPPQQYEPHQGHQQPEQSQEHPPSGEPARRDA